MQTALILQLGTRLAQEQMLEHLSKHEFVDCSVNNTFAGMEMKVDRLRWSLDLQGQHNYKKTRAQNKSTTLEFPRFSKTTARGNFQKMKFHGR